MKLITWLMIALVALVGACGEATGTQPYETPTGDKTLRDLLEEAAHLNVRIEAGDESVRDDYQSLLDRINAHIATIADPEVQLDTNYAVGEAIAIVQTWLTGRMVEGVDCLTFHQVTKSGPFVEEQVSEGVWLVSAAGGTRYAGKTWEWHVYEASNAVSPAPANPIC